MSAMLLATRVAALFDIHGNVPALEAVLDDDAMQGVDLIVVGGDALGGPFPRETYHRLMSLEQAVFLRGNGERELANPPDGDIEARWVADQLEPQLRRRMAERSDQLTVDIPGLGPVRFCHASPRSDKEYLTRISPDPRIRPMLAGVAEQTIVCGHTHTQFDRHVDGIRIINAGSVGMPYENEPGAYWTLVGPDIEPRRTPYDLADAADRTRATHFPGAETFARERILTRPGPDDAAAYFESLTRP